MEILDSFSIDSQNTVYAVALEPGFVVDVKVCKETGLVYVMQNEDGSTVYDQAFAEYTFLDYEYDEEAVIRFVKENCGLAGEKETMPSPALAERIACAEKRANTHTADHNNTEKDKLISIGTTSLSR